MIKMQGPLIYAKQKDIFEYTWVNNIGPERYIDTVQGFSADNSLNDLFGHQPGVRLSRHSALI